MAQLKFTGTMDDLSQAMLVLFETLYRNKTLSNDDLLELAARIPGLSLTI